MSIVFSARRLVLRQVCSFSTSSQCLCSPLHAWNKKHLIDYSNTPKKNVISNSFLKVMATSNLQLFLPRHCNTSSADNKVDKVLTVPNVLTLSRLLSAPVITYCVLNGAYPFAMCLFAAAGVTDVVDGYIARNWEGQSSVLGSIIDPLADKVLVVSLSLSLAYVNLLPVWLVSLILFRDFSLITGAAYLRLISLPKPRTVGKYFDVTLPTIQMRPSVISKFNTFVQLLLITTTLASPIFGFEHHLYLQYLCYLTALTTVLSGAGYLISHDCFIILGKKMTKK